MSILDLSDASSGFEPVDAGSYNATVFEIEMTETQGSNKLPAGVPMVKVQFKVQDEGPAEGRRFFNNFPLPTKEQSANAGIMQGSFVSFLKALGYDEKQLKSKGFDEKKLPELVGKECVIRLGYEPDKRPDHQGEFQNPVKGVKPAGSPVGTVGSTASDLL